jgi:hypothetical protein
MKKIKYKIIRILDLYFYPLLINGNKEQAYFERMKRKYKNEC